MRKITLYFLENFMENQPNIKTFIGFSLDHSASMRGITKAAARDYNTNIASIKQNAIEHNQDVIVSVVNCGAGASATVKREIINSSVTVLKPIPESNYEANGRGTPLYDSVGELIEMFEALPEASDINTSFLLMIITDGEENASIKWNAITLASKIKQLHATDRWSFVFRVPKGYGKKLAKTLDIFEGNIQEWEQTTKGLDQASQVTTQAIGGYFRSRATGATSTSSFYTSLDKVSLTEVKSVLTDISSEILQWTVQTAAEGHAIKDFVEHKLGRSMKRGASFYELVKKENKIQANKLILIQDKTSKHVYSGDVARDMIGLPKYSDVRVRPGDHSNFKVFVQSTSVNRILPVGTDVIYWENF
jgi:hypothetical protein